MSKRTTIKSLEYILVKLKEAQNKFPECRIEYDFETTEILILYPLPKDFSKLTACKLINKLPN